MTGLGPEANALLEAARGGDQPTHADEERVLAAIGKRLALGAASGLAVAAADRGALVGGPDPSAVAAVRMAWATKVLVGLALVGAIGAGAAMLSRRAPRPALPAGSVATGAPTSGEAIAQVQDRPDGAASPEAPAAGTIGSQMGAFRPSPRTMSGPRVPPAAGSSSRVAPPTGDVAAEVRLLSEAHAALRGGQPERALGLLEEHVRRYPRGALGEEREADRIAALCALGRVVEAREAADRFLHQAPWSPMAGPVRASCGGPLGRSAPPI
jgi:hypothetical protein